MWTTPASFTGGFQCHNQTLQPTQLHTFFRGRSTAGQRLQRIRLSAVQASEAPTYTLGSPIRREQLQEPAHIGARASSHVDIQDLGAAVGLNAYMQLPVNQYNELDPNMIKKLNGANSYALQVPRVQLFNVWVEPLVHVRVELLNNSAVLIEAVNWGIRGSDLIESLNLNRRFSLKFSTRLTWAPGSVQSANGSSNGKGSGSAVVPSHGQIHGDLELDVWSEVIGPFRFIPRSALEGVGNSVLNTLVSSLLPIFLRRLAADYKTWATDPEYRARRQQRSSVHPQL